jgi:hypothetical protein
MFEKSQRKEIKQQRRGDRKIRTRRKKTRYINIETTLLRKAQQSAALLAAAALR